MINKLNFYELQTSTKSNSSTSTQNVNKSNSIFDVNINGEIENTKQGNNGDCWFLTEINALNSTKWGKKLLKKAINKNYFTGNITITLKGSRGEQKEWVITPKEIIEAKQSGYYSSGDDDMIALELAFEKYYKKYGKEHNRTTNSTIPGAILHGGNIDDNKDIVELLSGENIESYIHLNPINYTDGHTEDDIKEFNNQIDTLLSEIEKNPNQYAIDVDLNYINMEKGLHQDHSYNLKKVITENGEKYVILINPHDSSKEIKMTAKEFKVYIRSINIIDKPGAEKNPKLDNVIDYKLEFYNRIKKYDDNGYQREDLINILRLCNKNNIMDIIKLTKNNIKLIIKICDFDEFGWTNGKDKKELIQPIVDSICDIALEKGVNKNLVEKARENCIKELDAIFYTDEEVIIENLENMLKEIKKIDDAEAQKQKDFAKALEELLISGKRKKQNK